MIPNPRFQPRMLSRGFTLIELSVSIGIISLIVTGAVFLVSLEVDTSRQSATIAKVLMLKRAIVGDPRIVTKESRTDFGYVGDMGSLPSSLQDLWLRGSQPAFTYDTARKTGAGWAGPYIDVGALELSDDLVSDAWGNGIAYVVQIGTSSTTGQQYRARIYSYGPDAAAGTADDISAEIYTTEMLSTVASYVRDSSGNPMPNVQVKMNYPASGALTTATTLSGSGGSYSFSGIPIGNRSLTVEPKLVYSEGSGVTLAGGDNVEFVMISYTCGTINSVTATFDTTAFYTKFLVGNNTVFNNTTNLAASGELVNFSSAIDVSWSGCGGGGTGLSQVYPVRIQSAFTQVPDQDIGAGASAGKSFRMKMNLFETLENGSGSSLDMTGTSFTVTFSNGAVATFTTVPQ